MSMRDFETFESRQNSQDTSRSTGSSLPGWAPNRGTNGASSSTFRLAVLGKFELTGPNGPVALEAKKLRGLLCFLVCQASPQPRDILARLLWGAHFETQAGQNLRQALS